MKLTETKIEEVNKAYSDMQRAQRGRVRNHGLTVENGIHGATIFKNGNWTICTIEELDSMIKELTEMKQAIENITGIC